MILQALCEYYQRKAALNEMPPYGREWRAIPYLIVIREDGHFVKLEETYEGEGKQREAKSFSMCHARGRSGSNSWKTANILWDHYGYVLGLPKKMALADENAVQTGKKQNESFVKEIDRLVSLNPNHVGIYAVRQFYTVFEDNLNAIKKDALFEDSVNKEGTNFAFKILGQLEPVGVDSTIDYGEDGKDAPVRLCLVHGDRKPIAVLNNSVSLIGASSMGAKLVGFQKGAGYDSYHKEQGLNAPISQQANNAYTMALNTMLAKDSKNHFYFSGDTLVFWASRENEFENQFSFFFAAPPKDNPDKSVEMISHLMKAPLSGTIHDNDETRFYILLLSPNVARIAVKLWEETTVREAGANIRQYFEDLNISRGKMDKPYYSLYELLANIALQNDTKNLPRTLFNGMVRAAIENLPFPALAQMQCIGRIKADRKVNCRRAGLLKAYLNRKNRNNKQNIEKDITMALDLENKNQAYLCGRLFAILERIQEESATGKLNATIRDRYYGAASRTPSVVFPRLIDLSNHHLVKLSEKEKVYYERMKGEVMLDINAQGFDTHFSLDDQSRFAIGYYHQRQFFYTKKEGANFQDNNNN